MSAESKSSYNTIGTSNIHKFLMTTNFPGLVCLAHLEIADLCDDVFLRSEVSQSKSEPWHYESIAKKINSELIDSDFTI